MKTKERSILFSRYNRSRLRRQPRNPGGSADNLITGYSERIACRTSALLQLAGISSRSNMHMHMQSCDVLLHSSTGLSSCCSADHRRAIGLGQATDILLKLKLARQSLKEQIDVLSQQPLAASPHFFSLKAPDPTQQEIVAVPARTTPPPAGKLTPSTRAHVSFCVRHDIAQPAWLLQHGCVESMHQAACCVTVMACSADQPSILLNPSCNPICSLLLQ